VRALPLRLAPIDGESLPGYVARYSHTFQFPPGDVITTLGLVDRDATVVSAGRYGVSLSPDRLERAAFATAIPVEALERMLLSRYAGRAFEQTATFTDVLVEAAQAHEVLIRSSKFCPQCLRERGAWMVRWQLGWSAACPHHRVLLARACPTCGTVPKDALRSRWVSDRHGPLSDPTRCTRRRGRELCRTHLAGIETPCVSDEAVDAQRRIDALLDGGPCPAFAGERIAPRVYLQCPHALSKLLAYHAQLPSGADRRPARPGRRLFDHSVTVATVLHAALALADLPDRQALIDAVREIVEDRYHQDGQTLRLGQLADVPDTLRHALRHALSEAVWAPPLTRIGLHPRAHRRPADLDPRLQTRHVPQLLWAEDYQQRIVELFDFDDFTHWHGRRICSLLLARMLTPLDWDAAVRYLDFPETFINKGYTTTSVKLRAIGRFNELIHRVKQIANQHAERDLIDYKQRRAQLTDWTGIDPEAWLLLQPRPGQNRWRADTPSRRARASIWLWCELTSGHERAAPIALPTSNLAHQGEFIRDALPDLRERLLILGQLLLTTPTDVRHPLPVRLEATLRERGLAIFRPDPTGRRRRLEPHEPRERPKPPRVPPTVADRVLAHVAAHTGVDIPTLSTTSFPGMQAPPAVLHARLLAAALLKQTWPTSWNAIGEAINQDGNQLADRQHAYQAACHSQPRLAAELDQLKHAIENPQTRTPSAPTTPHQQRMRNVAEQIQTRASELLAASHGAHIARRASIAACRQHTDLTCTTIAAIHRIADAQPAFSHATVARYRADDPEFDRRYQHLLDYTEQVRCAAGFANANLKRALTTARPSLPPVPNYVSHSKLG
jgi:hypothetical protein